MRFTKTIYLESGRDNLVEAIVSARVTFENGIPFVSDFETSRAMTPVEIEAAKEELIDRARCYPETGEPEREIFPAFFDWL